MDTQIYRLNMQLENSKGMERAELGKLKKDNENLKIKV